MIYTFQFDFLSAILWNLKPCQDLLYKLSSPMEGSLLSVRCLVLMMILTILKLLDSSLCTVYVIFIIVNIKGLLH